MLLLLLLLLLLCGWSRFLLFPAFFFCFLCCWQSPRGYFVQMKENAHATAKLCNCAKPIEASRIHCFSTNQTSDTHTLTRSHAHTLTRSHAHTLTRSHRPQAPNTTSQQQTPTRDQTMPATKQAPVLWAQREDCVYLTVEVADIQEPQVEIKGTTFSFK